MHRATKYTIITGGAAGCNAGGSTTPIFHCDLACLGPTECPNGQTLKPPPASGCGCASCVPSTPSGHKPGGRRGGSGGHTYSGLELMAIPHAFHVVSNWTLIIARVYDCVVHCLCELESRCEHFWPSKSQVYQIATPQRPMFSLCCKGRIHLCRVASMNTEALC